MEIGIIGLPNVGKSSLFNALTQAQAEAQNFPFTTIEPNVGIVEVPDPRLDFLTTTYNSAKKVPATIKFVDIAGLVKGAFQGEGLGNQFLSNIRACDAIAEVVRVFEDQNIIHVAGKVDPDDDIATINTELLLADLEQATSSLERAKKSKDAADIKLVPSLEKALSLLNNSQPLRQDPTLVTELVSYNFLTAKPLLYIANVSENKNPELVALVQKHADDEGAELIVISVKTELDVVSLPAEEQIEFRQELGLESGLGEVIKAGYKLLNLETFFTAGPKEAHAWTVTKGSRAPQAAGKIHTDFEKGFIRAQVFNVADLEKYGSEKVVKEAGRLRSEGKEYVVQDGDVIEFLFNV